MKQKVFRILADLRFSIFILLLISLCSILGTIIEQEQSLEFYKNKYPITSPILGFFSWDLILEFGLDRVYSTWWFLALLILFGSSLLLCSFLQQAPSLKIARRCQFFRIKQQFYALKMSTILKSFSFNVILTKIRKKQYSIFQQKNILYCYKGLIGRIAPLIVHFSMILVLIGITIGSLFGFKAQEFVPVTETFHIQNILNTGVLETIPKTTTRVNDFWLTYTKSKTVAQFYSDLAILDAKGEEKSRKTVKVNDPLIYKGIYYYQTNWNLVGLQFNTQKLKTKKIQYPLLSISNNQGKIWLTWVYEESLTENGVLFVIENLEGYCSSYDKNGTFLGNIELNEPDNFMASVRLSNIISSTGLQIKSDPGISLIYLGFLSLMWSSLVSYITYSQIWLISKGRDKVIFLGGTTNRALFEFELEFLSFAK